MRLAGLAIALMVAVSTWGHARDRSSGSSGASNYSAPRAPSYPVHSRPKPPSAPSYPAPKPRAFSNDYGAPPPSYSRPKAPAKPLRPYAASQGQSLLGNARTIDSRIRVHDGDTFYAEGKRYRVHGIDTPEIGSARSFAARDRLEQLLGSGSVTVEPRATDKYGRTVATVRINGRDVAEILRAEGYAKNAGR